MTAPLPQYESDLVAAIINSDNTLLNQVNAHSRISPQLAVDIYRNNTHDARLAALEQVYPVCVRILGDSVFRSIAREFVSRDEHGRSDLNTYGENLYLHLQQLIGDRRLPLDFSYLPDLSRLEYMLHRAYYADDDPAFDFTEFELALSNGIDIRFQLSSTLGLLTSIYPLYQIWINNRNQTDSSEVAAIEGVQFLVIHRETFRPAVTTIEHDTYRLLTAIAGASSLHQLLDGTDTDLDRQLPELIRHRWVVGINRHG